MCVQGCANGYGCIKGACCAKAYSCGAVRSLLPAAWQPFGCCLPCLPCKVGPRCEQPHVPRPPTTLTGCCLLYTEVLPQRAAVRQGRLLPNRQAVRRGECATTSTVILRHHVAHISITSCAPDVEAHTQQCADTAGGVPACAEMLQGWAGMLPWKVRGNQLAEEVWAGGEFFTVAEAQNSRL